MTPEQKYMVMKMQSGAADDFSLFALRGHDGKYNPVRMEVETKKCNVFGTWYAKENVKTNGDVYTIYTYKLSYSAN